MLNELTPNIDNKITINNKLTPEQFQTLALCNYLIKPNNDVVFLDTETTGFFGNSEIVELAICDSQGNVIFDKMFKPSVPMSPEASAVSGITEEMLADKPGFKESAQEVTELLAGKVIVGWNTPFDLRLIKQTYKSIGLDYDLQQNNLSYDAQNIAQSYFNTKVKLKQDEVMQCLQFDHGENHRAIDDVKDMIQIIGIFANKNNLGKVDDIAKYISSNKQEAIEVERKYGTLGVKTSEGRQPNFVKYMQDWLQTKDVQATANNLKVSAPTVKSNLMKAMVSGDLKYECLTRNLSIQEIQKAQECLMVKLGFKNLSTIFDDFSRSCGGMNYQRFSNEARNAGLTLEDLYDVALKIQLGII